MVEFFDYSHTAIPEYQIVKMPFNDEGLSMTFALPMSEDVGDVTSQALFDAMPELEWARVALALPKFQLEAEYEEILMTSLQDMGMVAPFFGNLCIQDGSCDTRLSRVTQKTFLNVDEDGVEAAAVSLLTGVTSLPTGDPVLFMADHPFQFFIYDETEKVFLFEGRVGSPGVVEGAAAPELMATHEDDDFWMTNFGVEPSVAISPEVLEQPSNPNTTDPGMEETGSNTTDPGNNTTDPPGSDPEADDLTTSAATAIGTVHSTLLLLVVGAVLCQQWLSY